MEKTCKNCIYWKRNNDYDEDDIYFGSCELIEDISETIHSKELRKARKSDRAYTSDYEEYSSYNHTGPDFGCIHWKWGYNNDE